MGSKRIGSKKRLSGLFKQAGASVIDLQGELDQCITHVCEVQLHLNSIVALKERSHPYYEFFRSCESVRPSVRFVWRSAVCLD